MQHFQRLVFALVGLMLSAAAEAPRSTVEGQLMVGGEPVRGARVILMRQFEDTREGNAETVADAEGRFRFENVPPGFYAVGHLVEKPLRTRALGGESWSDSYRRNIIVGEGGHIQLPPYPAGHTLKGKLVLPEGSKLDVAWQGEDMRMIYTPGAHAEIPEGSTPEESRRISEAFRATEEFKKAWLGSTMVVLDVHPDGTFEAQHVPPGDYQLWIDVGEHPSSPPAKAKSQGVAPAVAEASFTMPAHAFTLPDVVVKEREVKD